VGKGYERLSAQDSSFVIFEGAGSHAHVTAVAIFETGPLLAEAGGLDLGRMRAYIGSRLHTLARYRQKLAYTLLQRHPIWVDDPRFDLRYHVRHAALPQPGGDAELKELAGRVASQALDRDKPLWEIWFVEGLTGDRFAAIAKVHHSLVDGVSGVSVLTSLLSPTPDAQVEPAPAWKPRPPPGVVDFLSDGLINGSEFSASTLRALADAVANPRRIAGSVSEGAVAAWETLVGGLGRRPSTPINQPIGDQRRVAWKTLDLADVRDLRKRLDGSINDVVLTIVSGAVRRLLRKRRVRLRGLDFRITVPVDMREGQPDLEVGNKVSAWFVSLPVGERNPKRCFDRIRGQTRRLKQTKAADGIDLFLRLADIDLFLRMADWSGSTLLPSGLVNFVSVLRPYNMIVSNIQGPQVPLYLLGARLTEFFPHLPLFENQGLAVAAMSYLGKINFGLVGDWDLIPDLDEFADHLDEATADLREAANGGRASGRRRGRSRSEIKRKPLSISAKQPTSHG
jgi:WS/DGAT/MGAT family acyltransferase